MKFKFCGNLDCPEWLIGEIIFLTKISTIKLRIICNNLVNAFINKTQNYKDIKKSLEEMNFGEEECNIIISVLEFIIKNSAKFEVEESTLNQELQQLGLPQENADSITRVYKNHRENLRSTLSKEIFGFEKIDQVDYKISYILANQNSDFTTKITQGDELGDLLMENYKIDNIDTKINLIINNDHKYSLSKDLLGKLINDLEKANEMIKKQKE
jgi:hypothetical protein